MYSSGNFDPFYAGSVSPNRAEPMTLGTISPAGGGGSSPGSSGPAHQYLPNFLIGDTPTGFTPTGPRIWSMAGSPSKQQSKNTSNSPPSPMMPSNNNLSLHHQNSPHQSLAANQTPNRLYGSVKPNGPPVTGLFESMMSPVTNNNRNSSFLESSFKNQESMQMPNSPSFSMNRSASFSNYESGGNAPTDNKLYSSPAQLDPFYTQRESLTSEIDLDEAWVTVFGFPSAAASYILQQFSQYGSISEYKIEAGGNWMHLHYQSKLQAKKALSKNGKVYGGTVMVGVKPCIEKKLMNESAKENSQWNTSCSSKVDEENRSMSSIRPLTQAYKVSASERDVTKPTRTPQKSSNLISKTMDYMFGW